MNPKSLVLFVLFSLCYCNKDNGKVGTILDIGAHVANERIIIKKQKRVMSSTIYTPTDDCDLYYVKEGKNDVWEAIDDELCVVVIVYDVDKKNELVEIGSTDTKKELTMKYFMKLNKSWESVSEDIYFEVLGVMVDREVLKTQVADLRKKNSLLNTILGYTISFIR